MEDESRNLLFYSYDFSSKMWVILVKWIGSETSTDDLSGFHTNNFKVKKDEKYRILSVI